MQREQLQAGDQTEITDDGVQQMLELAERLREANGGELDESAILAVSEATGAPIEYVRLAVRLRPEEKKKGIAHRLRSEYLGLEPDVRRNVLAGSLGVVFALASVMSHLVGAAVDGLLGVVQILAATAVVYLVAVARDPRSAAITGALTMLVGFIATTIFQALIPGTGALSAPLLIPFTLFGTLGAMLVNMLVAKNRKKLGLKDPVKERQDLLRQLEDLKQKLNSGEQTVTFLCVDIVGSTRMKEHADHLSIEYTFNEYHQFVERITRKYGGRVHSTAGDGMICAFDSPAQAFGAAKNMQAGMIELNTFGNKTGIPMALRAGIHTGVVVAPNPGDIASVNFAHVIDIAAHMQKVSPVGGIAISEPAATGLPGGAISAGMERVEIQNVVGILWSAKPVAAASSAKAPPPFPA